MPYMLPLDHPPGIPEHGPLPTQGRSHPLPRRVRRSHRRPPVEIRCEVGYLRVTCGGRTKLITTSIARAFALAVWLRLRYRKVSS